MVAGAGMLANIANTPELDMTPEQAQSIREDLEELAKLYPIGLSPKTMAWGNLSFSVGGWLVPGLIAWWRAPARPRIHQVPRTIQRQPEPQPVRPEAPQPQDLPLVGTVAGAPAKRPEEAKAPSEMWLQPGDIEDDEPERQ